MSISSMTRIAASKADGSKGDTAGAIQAVANYIPSEILTLYVAALAITQEGKKLSNEGALYFFLGFAILTPVFVWLVFAAKRKASKHGLPWSIRLWPKWEMFAATVAFAAWGLALPDNPFQAQPWYSTSIGGGVVLAVSLFLPALASLFQGSPGKGAPGISTP